MFSVKKLPHRKICTVYNNLLPFNFESALMFYLALNFNMCLPNLTKAE